MKNRNIEKLEAITLSKLVVGVDIAKEIQWARFVDYRGLESGKTLKFYNDKDGFDSILASTEAICKSKRFEVPTIKVDDLTPEQVKAFRIAYNKTAEYAEWNFELLAQELKDLKLADYDLSLTAFDLSECERLIDSLKEESSGENLHPTMKPVALVVRAIKNSSNMKEIILDLFGGSGTTLIACIDTDRRCMMMELDPRYADVIVKRYVEKVGSDADVYLIRDGKKIKYADIINEQIAV